jgi:myosin-1
MARRIQRAYRNYVAYKNTCATKIQRAFRHWLKTKMFLQLRNYGDEVLGQRKERKIYG